MREKKKKLIITFHTTADAMEMEGACRENNLSGRLIPVPRKISAGCGLAWCSEPDTEAVLLKVMKDVEIAHQELHKLMI